VKIDFGDVFASGIGLLVKQLVLFILAAWLGCSLAAAAYLAGKTVEDRAFPWDSTGLLLGSPVLLLTVWLLPNIVFLAAFGIRTVIYSDSAGYRTWITLIAGEALFSMAMVTHEFRREWAPLTTAWLTCLLLIGMMGTALWFLRQWHMNRWAIELEELKAENAMRRVQLKEKFGTDSAGIDETGIS